MGMIGVEMTLAEYVRRRRLQLGMTQRQVTDQMPSVGDGWLSHLETGTRKELPSPPEIRELAHALRVTVVDLLEAADYIPSEEAHQEAGYSFYGWLGDIERIEDLPDADLQTLREVTEAFRKLVERGRNE